MRDEVEAVALVAARYRGRIVRAVTLGQNVVFVRVPKSPIEIRGTAGSGVVRFLRARPSLVRASSSDLLVWAPPQSPAALVLADHVIVKMWLVR